MGRVRHHVMKQHSTHACPVLINGVAIKEHSVEQLRANVQIAMLMLQ